VDDQRAAVCVVTEKITQMFINEHSLLWRTSGNKGYDVSTEDLCMTSLIRHHSFFNRLLVLKADEVK
jgi:hypothetical protein